MSGVSSKGFAVISLSAIAATAAVAVSWSFLRLHWKRKVSVIAITAEESDHDQTRQETDKQIEQDAIETCEDSSIPMSVIELDTSNNPDDTFTLKTVQTMNTISICYASITGTCSAFAQDLYTTLLQMTKNKNNHCTVQLCTVDQIDWWEELLSTHTIGEESSTSSLVLLNQPPSRRIPPIVLFILPTWTQGTLPEPYSILLTSINEILNDWRVAPQPLRHRESSSSNNYNNNNTTDHKLKMKHPSTLRIASFGIGSSAYNHETFCKPAKDVFASFMKLGAHSLLVSRGATVVGMGDVEMSNHADIAYGNWKQQVLQQIQYLYDLSSSTRVETVGEGDGSVEPLQQASSCCSNSIKNDGKTFTSCACMDMSSSTTTTTDSTSKEMCNHDSSGSLMQQEEKVDLEAIYEEEEEEEDDDDLEEEDEAEILDLEDIGDLIQASSSKNTTSNDGKESDEPKEMLTSKQAAALKKEGYRIIGTHSAVKLCRWTKHQLRGRGGCYKHTFYGITSYQCMEVTPSLACANKCVFCWRHHKNPVGKEWKWKTDDPYYIVDQAIQLHISMIREAKGIPGVVAERWREAHTVRHCALSLVGEPIMYPRINELLGDLHKRCISTFLVTNGQHPHAIETVIPVTQLYVSVDASTPETLEAIDRPLFSDAWDRLCSSLTSLKNRGQRTVARLTVVKGWNSDEIEGYAKLIALGHCSFIEIKGVTFCGKSDASNLNMSNSPYHHEVVTFAKKLVEILSRLRMDSASISDYDNNTVIPEYDISCEHKHSCSVLIARVDLFGSTILPDGRRQWRTWIDYDKFNELAMKYAMDPTITFTANDYSAETPTWALFGAVEEGFDPQDGRYRKKSKFPKYTQFDEYGVPTHDEYGKDLNTVERKRLNTLMEKKKAEIGDGQSITYSKDGSKRIDDASLMFRGMTVNLL